jgi:trans-aconitate methyltransferase
MAESLFDEFVEDYEDACERGLSLSGESRDYFAQQRVRQTRALCADTPVHRMLDFGCGVGHATPHLLEVFPQAALVGLDTSARSIAAAQQRYGNARASFTTGALDPDAFDLAYSNGTFHHIDPRERPAVLQHIFTAVRPGGMFALWENNPWNPGTRMVMKRIPFDRDAQTLSYREASALLRGSGFAVAAVSFHFYFPSWLKALRSVEKVLTSLPLGAQYCVVGQKPDR